MPQIHSSRDLFNERHDAVYDVLSYLEPGLMLDVGAAAGMLTQRMLEKSPQSSVIALEPFPGNHPYLEQRVGVDPRVTIVKAAVANSPDPSTFLVGKTVQGSEPGWENYVGYSSAGYIVPASKADHDTTITVPTVRIDDIVGNDRVRFMKVDVQGGELGVMQSATKAIADSRVDIMFVEFNGAIDVMAYVVAAGFEVFDSEYLLITKEDDADLRAWYTFRASRLSDGRSCCRGWPLELPGDPADYCTMFREQRGLVGSVWTDLVCVRSGFVDEYLTAARSAS